VIYKVVEMSVQPQASQPELRTVFIDNFEKGVTTELLYKCLQKYNVKAIQINKYRYASVEFPTEALAKEAMLNQNCKPLLKRPVRMSLKCDKAVLTEFHLQGL
jgi:hypothetical protein